MPRPPGAGVQWDVLTTVHLHLTSQVFISDGYDLGTGNLGLPQDLTLMPQELEKVRVGMDTDRFSVLSMRNGNISTKRGGYKGCEGEGTDYFPKIIVHITLYYKEDTAKDHRCYMGTYYIYNISKKGKWAVNPGGNPPEGQINLAASSSCSSSLADAGGKRRAPGIKMNPLGKEDHTALLSIFI